jgi:hypothetical protein
MKERHGQPRVGDDVVLEGVKYRIRGISFEEGSVILTRVSDDGVMRLLRQPTWEWDDRELLWRATHYRLLEDLQ